MARKAGKTARKTVRQPMEKNLPQNILSLGEHVEENKRIYISQPVYKEIHRFTEDKTSNESGGMLIGNVIEEFGKINIIIQGFVEAKYTEATPTTLKFTHETWEYVHAEIQRRFEGGQIIGWIHTHPDFGIFLSEYDLFIHQNFFKEDYQIAYVVDPIQHIEGFYFWINGRIEKCKGFYIYDKTGEKIEIDDGKAKTSEMGDTPGRGNKLNPLYILSGIMALLVIVFALISLNLFARVTALESQQEDLVDAANQNFYIIGQNITALASETDILQSQIDTYHPTEAASDEVTGDEQPADSVVPAENTPAATPAAGTETSNGGASNE